LARPGRGHLARPFTFLTGAFSRSRGYIERILSSFNDISEQALFLKDLFEFFEMEPTIRSAPGALPAPRPIRQGFEFRHVGFAYPGSSRMVVRDIDFRLYPREKIALIGENGPAKRPWSSCLPVYDPPQEPFCSMAWTSGSTTSKTSARKSG
jgi:ATP-binding cassette subfamily B protein